MDLSKLSTALESLGSLAPGNFPVHHAQVLLFIAEKGSCTYRDIEERFDVTNASASRIVHTLSETVRHRETCLGLCEIYIDPEEGRRYRVRLSKKGKAKIRSLEGI
tara:strand:+ start:130 stop:447 length:318 start_codon:yes stop_codon:yes gene_type:complete